MVIAGLADVVPIEVHMDIGLTELPYQLLVWYGGTTILWWGDGQ